MTMLNQTTTDVQEKHWKRFFERNSDKDFLIVAVDGTPLLEKNEFAVLKKSNSEDYWEAKCFPGMNVREFLKKYDACIDFYDLVDGNWVYKEDYSKCLPEIRGAAEIMEASVIDINPIEYK